MVRPGILPHPAGLFLFAMSQTLSHSPDLLGLYLSDHPLQTYLPRFEKAHVTRISELPEMPDRAEIMLGGIITSIKPFTSKKSGEPMAFFNLEDMTGTVSCTMFPSSFAAHGHHLEKDRIVLLKGKASHRERVREDDEGGHIVEVLAEEIYPLANGGNTSERINKIMIQVDPSKREVLKYVRETVEQYRGNGSAAPVHVRVQDGGEVKEVRTELLAEYNDAFRQALERLLGRQSVWVE